MNETIISLALAASGTSFVAALLALLASLRKAKPEPVRVKIRVEDERNY